MIGPSIDIVNLPAPAAENLPAVQDDKAAYKEWRKGKGWFVREKNLCEPAVKDGNTAAARYLMSRGFYKEILHATIEEKKTEMFFELIKEASEIECMNEYDESLLNTACGYHDNLEIAKYLIEKGADINNVTKYLLRTPLISAATYGRKEIVELLLEHGASEHHHDHTHKTAREQALKNEYMEIAELLGHKQPKKEKKAVLGWSVSGESNIVTNTSIDKKQGMTITHIFDFNAKEVFTKISCGDDDPAVTRKTFTEIDEDFLNTAKQQKAHSKDLIQSDKPKLV